MSTYRAEARSAANHLRRTLLAVLWLCGAAALLLPGTAEAANPSSTGGGIIRFDLGFVVLDYQFSGHTVTLGNGDVTGHFAVRQLAPLDFFPFGRFRFRGETSCIEIDGDLVTFSGLSVGGWNARTGTPFPAGLCWLLRAVDGGHGPEAGPDLGSLLVIFPCEGSDSDELCRNVPDLMPPGLLPIGVVIKGNHRHTP